MTYVMTFWPIARSSQFAATVVLSQFVVVRGHSFEVIIGWMALIQVNKGSDVP